jgi:Protein of unknown function (DUF2971)
MWCFESSFMNDPFERSMTFDRLAVAYQELRAHINSTPEGCAHLADDRWFSDKIEEISKVTSDRRQYLTNDNGRNSAYVASFTSKRDDLAMWRAYTPTTGVCIGFDKDLIHAISPKRFRPVTYVSAQSGNINQIDTAFGFPQFRLGVDSYIAAAPKANQPSPAQHALYMAQQPFLSAFLHYHDVFFKDASFEFENETRLVIPNVHPFTKATDSPISERKYFASSKTIRPYVELNTSQAIREVVVGPSIDSAYTVDVLNLLATAIDGTRRFEACGSSLNFRHM